MPPRARSPARRSATTSACGPPAALVVTARRRPRRPRSRTTAPTTGLGLVWPRPLRGELDRRGASRALRGGGHGVVLPVGPVRSCARTTCGPRGARGDRRRTSRHRRSREATGTRRRVERTGCAPPPIRTFTVGPGVPPGQPADWLRPGRGLSPPVRNCTDPGARELCALSRRFCHTVEPTARSHRPSGRHPIVSRTDPGPWRAQCWCGPPGRGGGRLGGRAQRPTAAAGSSRAVDGGAGDEDVGAGLGAALDGRRRRRRRRPGATARGRGFAISSRARRIFGSTMSRNAWPPKPGSTVMTSSMSSSGSRSAYGSIGVRRLERHAGAGARRAQLAGQPHRRGRGLDVEGDAAARRPRRTRAPSGPGPRSSGGSRAAVRVRLAQRLDDRQPERQVRARSGCP